MRALALSALAIVVLASAAAAETKADVLFRRGKKLLAQKKYRRACAMLEKVDRLDPAIGAKLNVARCYEEWGKLALAYRWYTDAEAMATDSRDKRAPKIREIVEQLDIDVPRLTIHLPEGFDPAAAVVELDGKPFTAFDVEHRVNPGKRVIRFRAGGKMKKKVVPLDRGASSEITLDIPKDEPAPPTPAGEPTPPTPKPTPEPDPGPAPAGPPRWRTLTAYALAGAGLVGFGVAGYLTLDARSTYNDALRAHCMDATNLCDDEGVRITRDARGRANLATGVAIAGAAMIAGGVVLYLTTPRTAPRERAAYVVPTIGPAGGGVAFGGRF